MRVFTIKNSVVISAITASLMGCEAPPEDLETAEQSLYGAGSLGTKWESGNVKVCWQQGSDTEALQAVRENIRNNVEDTWGRVAKIKFNWVGTCSSTTSTKLPKTVAIALDQARSNSQMGQSASNWTNINIANAGATNAALHYVSIHEFGHALAFAHEQERPDNFDAQGKFRFCGQFDQPRGAVPFASPGGQNFTVYDPASVMNYCGPNTGHLTALDVAGVRAAYGSTTTATCQELSDTYGIVANATFGFAPAAVRTTWAKLRCKTVPTSGDTCQKLSDRFGIVANETFAFAPEEARTFWSANGCSTVPRSSETACQRASDLYGIDAGVTFGSAPTEVQTWWINNSCNTLARPNDGCQRLSDRYGISQGNNAWAPTEARTWFQNNGCRTSPVVNRCQMLSDLYGVTAGVTFGFAPPEARTFWTNNSCNTRPRSTNVCQTMSEFYGINASVNFGFAPDEARTFWTTQGCNTKPFSADTCQKAANEFAILPNVNFGGAPPAVSTFWTTNSCNVHAK